MDTQEMTLREAREDHMETIKTVRHICPCCDRGGQYYNGTINTTMIIALLWLERAGGWVHVPTKAPEIVIRSNRLSSLKWWGLVAVQPLGPEDDLSGSGMWRITEKGKSFLQGKSKIRYPIRVYNDRVMERSFKRVTFLDIQRRAKKFSLEDALRIVDIHS